MYHHHRLSLVFRGDLPPTLNLEIPVLLERKDEEATGSTYLPDLDNDHDEK